MTTTQAVAEVHEPRAIDIFKAQFEKAAATIIPLLPAHITEERFKSMVITTIAYNPKLQKCSPTSLLRAVADLAELGLSTNPNLKEADILPVWSKDGDVAQARPRYTGLMKLARQGGDIVDIYAHAVYSNEYFTYEYGLEKKLEHWPNKGDDGKLLEDRGELTFAYCVWKTRDGERGFEVIDKKRIERSKNSSEGYKAFKAGRIKSTPWADHEEEMWRKTAVRAGSKYMPQSTESEAFRRALALADDNEFDEDLPKAQLATADAQPAIAAPRPARTPPPSAVAEEARHESYEMDRAYRDIMREDGAPVMPPQPITIADEPQFPTGHAAVNIAPQGAQATQATQAQITPTRGPSETEAAYPTFTILTDSKGGMLLFPTIEEWEDAMMYRISHNKPGFVRAMEKANSQIIADIDADYPDEVARVRKAFAEKSEA